MLLLIDGYNLMHATDLFGEGEHSGTLRGSREALLAFLAERLSAPERDGTVIVFDAADAPPGLPDRGAVAGIEVRFARGYDDADAMIEALLDAGRPCRGLTVVSGDRRVQRAARSAGAKWIGSAEWFADLRRRPATRTPDTPDRPTHDAGDPQDWIAEFSDPEALAEAHRRAATDPVPAPRHAERLPDDQPATAAAEKTAKPKKKRRPPLADPSDKPRRPFGEGLFDPFPPGYADDLLGGDSPPRPRR